jgi:hypothetical protein
MRTLRSVYDESEEARAAAVKMPSSEGEVQLRSREGAHGPNI